MFEMLLILHLSLKRDDETMRKWILPFDVCSEGLPLFFSCLFSPLYFLKVERVLAFITCGVALAQFSVTNNCQHRAVQKKHTSVCTRARNKLKEENLDSELSARMEITWHATIVCREPVWLTT